MTGPDAAMAAGALSDDVDARNKSGDDE